MKEGTRVRALVEIWECDFPEIGRCHTHANPGDLGTVVSMANGVPTVKFDVTGTSTIVHPEEVEVVK